MASHIPEYWSEILKYIPAYWMEKTFRVIYIYGDISPIIDGFTIQNGDASGLATNCSGTGLTAGGCGGGIFVYQAAAQS